MFLLDDKTPDFGIKYALLFPIPTWTPTKEQTEYLIKNLQNIPSNLREKMEELRTKAIFAIAREFEVSRTKAWEFWELFISDYMSDNPLWKKKGLITNESYEAYKAKNKEFWKDFQQ